jgi:hypothetical protein
MLKTIRAAALSAIAGATLAFAGGAQAAFVFSNDAGGDGTLLGTVPSFSIIGSDNGSGYDTAFYVQTFTTSEIVTFTWSYSTADSGGGVSDPAGFIHNGVETQLSVDGDPGEGSSGTWSEIVTAGDTFGWYVESIDSGGGCAELDVNGGGGGAPACVFNSGGGTNPVPEPHSLVLMLTGLAAIWVAARRRRNR